MPPDIPALWATWLNRTGMQGAPGSLLKSAIIVLLALALARAGNLLAARLFHHVTHQGVSDQRVQTISSLSRSALSYAVYFMAGMLILESFGVEAGALLAGVGFLGLAVSIGAQSLVRDVLNGFLILAENQFAVGDYITAGTLTGTVEEIGLRATRLRQWTGELHILPNGQIDRVTNFTRGPALAQVTVNVPYEANLRMAIGLLQEVCRDHAGGMPGLLEDPQVQGAVDFAESGVALRVVAACEPMLRWEAERRLRLCLKEALERGGIMLGYPRRVLLQQGGEQYGELQPGGRGADEETAPMWQ